MGETELQSDVKSDYSEGVKINSLADLKGKDPTGSRDGMVGAEGRSADGIIQIPNNASQDARAKQVARNEISQENKYNASCNNCSTFAQRVIKSTYPGLDASQMVRPSGALRLLYKDGRVVAPNNLYNAALRIKGATNIKGPSSVGAKPYLEYFRKSNRN